MKVQNYCNRFSVKTKRNPVQKSQKRDFGEPLFSFKTRMPLKIQAQNYHASKLMKNVSSEIFNIFPAKSK